MFDTLRVNQLSGKETRNMTNKSCKLGCIAKHDRSEVGATFGFCFTADEREHNHRPMPASVEQNYTRRGYTDDDAVDDWRDRNR
jgi:hypothetical protein